MTVHSGIGLWFIAFVPLALLLLLLVVRKWGAAEAGVVGWLVTAVIALTIFGLPVDSIGLETAKGVFESVTIIYIVVAAILIYEVADAAGAFAPFQRGMRRMFSHPLLQIMAIGLVFDGFLQGITGFGVPVAVCAPLLVGIGVRPVYAVVIAMIGQAWNNTFGTLGAAWVGLQQVTDLNPAQNATAALQTAVLIAVIVVIGGLTVALLYGGLRGVAEGALAVLALSVAQGGITVALAQWNPTLNGFAASLFALVVVAGLARLPMYRRPSKVRNSKIMVAVPDPGDGSTADDPGATGGSASGAGGSGRGAATGARLPEAPAAATATGGVRHMSLGTAFVPYATLVVVTCVVLLIQPLNAILERPAIGLYFPSVATDRGFHTPAETESFAFVTHAGTLLLVTAVVSYVIYRRRRYLAARAWRGIVSKTIEKSVAPTIAVIALVGMAAVMRASGQATVLATQVAHWTGGVYVVLAPAIGMFGTFVTGSNMSSNLLFGNFQQATAQAGGLSTTAVLSAHTAGGAAASAIAPSKVLLGTTTAGVSGEEGTVIRRVLPFVLVAVIVLGVVTVFL